MRRSDQKQLSISKQVRTTDYYNHSWPTGEVVRCFGFHRRLEDAGKQRLFPTKCVLLVQGGGSLVLVGKCTLLLLRTVYQPQRWL